MFSGEKEGEDWSFRPIEVTKGTQDGDWIAIDFLSQQETNTQYAYNNAYYLMAELKKGESEHSH